jgi:hypothetical protein
MPDFLNNAREFFNQYAVKTTYLASISYILLFGTGAKSTPIVSAGELD